MKVHQPIIDILLNLLDIKTPLKKQQLIYGFEFSVLDYSYDYLFKELQAKHFLLLRYSRSSSFSNASRSKEIFL